MCEGACDRHIGKVVMVNVKDNERDLGRFWYCEQAIAADRLDGYTVEAIDEQQGQ